MRRTMLTRWFAAPLLFAALALAHSCTSDDSGPGGAGGTGGTGGAGGTGGTGGGPRLVVCDELMGDIPYDGDLCNAPGDICDVPCGVCYYECGDDLIWHEHCWTCPGERPEDGDLCDPVENSGRCGYPPETACGPGSSTVLTCDAATSSWQEEGVEPCDAMSSSSQVRSAAPCM